MGTMKKRPILTVFLLTCVTGGIYLYVWLVKTKDEMNSAGADIPTAWDLIVPIMNIWWVWKWAGGVEHVTRGRLTQVTAFLYMFLLSVIGMALVQVELNKAIDEAGASGLPQARVA